MANDLRYLQVEQTVMLQPSEQGRFTAMCPVGFTVVAGGYKMVASDLPTLHLVMV